MKKMNEQELKNIFGGSWITPLPWLSFWYDFAKGFYKGAIKEEKKYQHH